MWGSALSNDWQRPERMLKTYPHNCYAFFWLGSLQSRFGNTEIFHQLAMTLLVLGLALGLAANLCAYEQGEQGFADELAFILSLRGSCEKILEISSKAILAPKERIKRIETEWKASDKSLNDSMNDSIIATSQIGQVILLQGQRISRLIEKADSSVGASATEEVLSEITQTSAELERLIPIFTATSNSKRSALLVVSSVGCACELERCSKMKALYDSLRVGFARDNPDSATRHNLNGGGDGRESPGDHTKSNILESSLGGENSSPDSVSSLHSNSLTGADPNLAISMIDLMQVPALEKVLGVIDIPSWILFDETGSATTIVAGDSDPTEIRMMLESWLDSSQESGREVRANE